MSKHHNAFDNQKVDIGAAGEKGRTLIARRNIAARELIIRSPVKLLDPMEYQVLRLIPAIRRFAAKHPEFEEADVLNRFMFGMMRLAEDPGDVLGAQAPDDDFHGIIMHTFTWPRPEQDGGETAALAFGLSSLCNHAPDESQANAEVVRDHANRHIDLMAIREIGEGEEILIRYATVPFEAV